MWPSAAAFQTAALPAARWKRVPLLPTARDSHWPRTARVRRRVLQELLGAPWQKVGPLAERLLTDDVPAVRSLAQFIARKNGQDLRAACLRSVSNEEGVKAGAVAGLGETGQASDSAMIEPFLAHERARLRAAAIAALHRLRPEESVGHVTNGLADPSGRVRKTCVRLLIGDRSPQLPPRVRAVYEEGNADTRVAALRFLAWRGGLEALSDVLQAMLDEDGGVRLAARGRLSKWMADYQASPWALRSSQEWIPRVKERLGLLAGEASDQELQELKYLISDIEKRA